MGPSGSGKTTLLKCLSGRLTTNVSGKIGIRVKDTVNFDNNIRIGFVPQQDGLFMQFTIRETVMFASRMNNVSFNREDHGKRVNEIISSLDLMTISGSKLSDISGGELKRTSISLELVSRPQILILDEPTTGLDSDNSESVISLLKNMCQDPTGSYSPIIIATIHQPSYETFRLFDQVYLLSKYGSNIYAGSPLDVMSCITETGLPERSNINPADYLIEVANEKHGKDVTDKMMSVRKQQLDPDLQKQTQNDEAHLTPMSMLTHEIHGSWVAKAILLTKRRLSGDLIKSHHFYLSVLLAVMSTLILVYIPKERMGQASGCWREMFVHGDENISEVDAIKQSLVNSKNSSSGGFMPDVINQTDRIRGSISFFLFFAAFNMLTPAVTVSTYYPPCLGTIFREINNHWYNSSSFFISMIVCEVIFAVLCTLCTTPIAWFAGGFPIQVDQFLMFASVICLVCILCCFRGIIFAIIFAPNSIFTLIAMCAFTVMMIVGSGFLIKTPMTTLWQYISYTSEFTYMFTISLTAAFGFGRCDETSSGLSDHIIHAVMTDKSLLRLATGIWPLLNVTAADLEHLAVALNLRSTYFNPLIDPLDELLGSNRDPGSSNNYDAYHDPSYVLDDHGISDADVVPCFVSLSVSCFLVCLLAFVSLKVKIAFSK